MSVPQTIVMGEKLRRVPALNPALTRTSHNYTAGIIATTAESGAATRVKTA
jgi:hypothetical protein